ncbi:MAG TPA: hypothetical protein VL361_14290 [Candidatus Limnocylindrales bacterium]|nr:hypothetical protein [Candidatus Limnocylindrales bacterium]
MSSLKNLYFAGSILSFALATSAFGMAGTLTSPGLAFPEDFPSAIQINLLAVVRKPEFKFLNGQFINSTTTLRYGGDTRALNEFLDQLSRFPGIIVSLSFGAEPWELIVTNSTRLADESLSWTVSHSAFQPEWLGVRINPHSKALNLQEFNLVIRGSSPQISEQKSEHTKK